MTQPNALAIVLAAGKGTRMKSGMAKVMHSVAGAPMVQHVALTAREAGIGRCALVVAPGMDEVRRAAQAPGLDVSAHEQREQLGTAHAVLAAREAFEGFEGTVLVLYGDTPLLTPGTLEKVLAGLHGGADLVVLGFHAKDPSGYGRLIVGEQGRLLAIREHKDASPGERKIAFCNSGVFGFRGEVLVSLLERIGNSNA
ncbi:MAG: NTP transferase domain-containing protein, partial [Pseudomonadota bacterium]|nr:NTP transferase domain-containing protein [Pseudomonadota bacterium]